MGWAEEAAMGWAEAEAGWAEEAATGWVEAAATGSEEAAATGSEEAVATGSEEAVTGSEEAATAWAVVEGGLKEPQSPPGYASVKESTRVLRRIALGGGFFDGHSGVVPLNEPQKFAPPPPFPPPNKHCVWNPGGLMPALLEGRLQWIAR